MISKRSFKNMAKIDRIIGRGHKGHFSKNETGVDAISKTHKSRNQSIGETKKTAIIKKQYLEDTNNWVYNLNFK